MCKKIKNIVFDLDGTLLNTLDDIADSVNYVLKKNNMPERTVTEVKNFVGNGIPMLMHRAVPLGTDSETEKNVLDEMLLWYRDHALIKTKPYEGISEMLGELKKIGIHSAVVTNKSDDAARELVNDLFNDSFDFVQGDNKKIKLKPNPDAVLEVMRLMNAERETTVYVGDSDVDILTAKNAGLKSIGCLWGFRDFETLTQAGADYIAEMPSDIVDIVKNEFIQ